MRPEPSTRLIKALAVCAELTQTDLSKTAAEVMALDLARYPEEQVLGALTRCRRELKPRTLTIAAILERLEDGRPGPEEAWSMLPKEGNDALAGHYAQGETSARNPRGLRWVQEKSPTVVWTVEMRAAFAIADALIRSSDVIQARMAFTESYKRLVQKARDAGEKVVWEVSPGTDQDQKALVLLDAAQKGRIPTAHVRGYLGYVDEGVEARLLAIEGKPVPQLPPPRPVEVAGLLK